ncbi:MAG: Gfo/Idh/MocA family oxidoreductase [Candidatus Omnitrophica bacterium]|nr:Gfo/Idh/MocA family oxidoreductase [Candidatus Omnitrophota bacterium]
MNSPLKIAVIGAGKLGARHAEVYAKLPGVTLVGVCDILESRAKEAALHHRTRAFTDYRDLLGQVDAASIAVPSHKHYEISKEFLEKNSHLLIEKPITTDLAHADELLMLAREKNLTIQVGHIERYNSAIRTIKNIIKVPRFIECHRLGSYDPRVADVGVTLDLMIHDIDIVLDLVRSPIKNVDAVGAFILSKTEDIANARIRFANNCVADLTASRVTQDTTRKIRIFQDDAYISLDYVTQEALIYKKENGRIDFKKIDIQKSDSLKEELADFIDCVRTGRQPLVSGAEGREALALALQISKQIREQSHPG